MTTMRSDELQDLVEVLADQQHGGAAVARLHDAGADLGDGREVEAEAGIGDDQQVALARELARQHGALHVAAGQALDGGVGAGRLDAIGLDQAPRRARASGRA